MKVCYAIRYPRELKANKYYFAKHNHPKLSCKQIGTFTKSQYTDAESERGSKIDG